MANREEHIYQEIFNIGGRYQLRDICVETMGKQDYSQGTVNSALQKGQHFQLKSPAILTQLFDPPLESCYSS